MWTLILVIFHHTSGASSVSAEHVDGFTTRQTCIQAGQSVQKDVAYNETHTNRVLYQCVKK